ncbi:glycosyltransferase family 39 protein [Marinobacter nanhaiticus D15-8W]|uniref:Glycosyltransferase family 39 protein n=1 Tax=Marinobacter nanhaiticus D15-8W TaxID=626887 RepID=N6WY09_9GAMM|nr:glycosyltransferase family 39 protein [Marinobacter nanhaiticus]ENO16491.1 glycosyltransferase family 39 protein [Marinobacter nanhaiticus D15-8W]BES72280.1 glycosyltransferase family 39 protein [Marinobacter nanhaiticus D15-8W]
MSSWARRPGTWVAVLVAILASRLLSMAIFPFVDTTEPRYAEIARLMVETNDWITPWFEAGVPFWGKPPLSFWAQAGAIKLFGLNEFALRLPSWLCIVAIVWLTWRYALVAYNERIARWSALILSTMALTYISAGAVMTDPFLALGTTLSLVSFGMVVAQRGAVWRWLFFVGLVIGMLAKGPLAVVLVGLPVALWSVFRCRWYFHLRDLPWFRGTLLTLALVLPWYIAAEFKTPGFLDYFIVGEHIKRFIDPGWAGDMYGSAHVRPKGMIWVFWLWASFPWGIIVAVGLLAGLVKGYRRTLCKFLDFDKYMQFIVLSALAPLLFFTMASNTLWTYVLPSLPFSAIVMANGIAFYERRRREADKLAFPAMVAVPFLTTVFAIIMTASQAALKTEQVIAEYYASQSRPGDSQLFYLDDLPFSAGFYSRGNAVQASLDDVLRMRESGQFQRYFLAVPKQEEPVVLQQLPASTQVATENRRYVLLQFGEQMSRTEG